MSLIESLHNDCHTLGFDPTYWIAFSGGLDSTVLLHALATLRTELPIKLRAVHVHHNLSPNADAWSNHCAQLCHALQVDFTLQKINARAEAGASPEDTARQKRYAAMATLLAPHDLLFTAHHQDDQAETLLLQLVRGAGPKGLAAMPRSKPLGNGLQIRPLLHFSRADLQAYAEENQLQWIEDESNANENFSRNFMRHQVIPLLQQRWPSVTTTLSRVAENCAQAQHLLTLMAAEDLVAVTGTVPNTLAVKKLLNLSPERQGQVVRYWLQQLNFPLPSTAKLHQALHDMLHARIDKVPCVTWEGVELRRFRYDLYALTPLTAHDTTQVLPWDLQQPLQLAGVGELQAQASIGQGLRVDIRDITIRFRHGGETCHLPGHEHSHDLKKLLQSWNIPTWQRDRIPLLYAGDKLAAAVGLFVDKEFLAQAGERGYQVLLNV